MAKWIEGDTIPRRGDVDPARWDAYRYLVRDAGWGLVVAGYLDDACDTLVACNAVHGYYLTPQGDPAVVRQVQAWIDLTDGVAGVPASLSAPLEAMLDVIERGVPLDGGRDQRASSMVQALSCMAAGIRARLGGRMA